MFSHCSSEPFAACRPYTHSWIKGKRCAMCWGLQKTNTQTPLPLTFLALVHPPPLINNTLIWHALTKVKQPHTAGRTACKAQGRHPNEYQLNPREWQQGYANGFMLAFAVKLRNGEHLVAGGLHCARYKWQQQKSGLLPFCHTKHGWQVTKCWYKLDGSSQDGALQYIWWPRWFKLWLTGLEKEKKKPRHI